jgi:hypothetical protein
LFDKCLGGVFTIAEVEDMDGAPGKLLRLDVGHALGKKPYMETIWIEPQFVELARDE